MDSGHELAAEQRLCQNSQARTLSRENLQTATSAGKFQNWRDSPNCRNRIEKRDGERERRLPSEWPAL